MWFLTDKANIWYINFGILVHNASFFLGEQLMFTRILVIVTAFCCGLASASTFAAEAETYALGDWLYQIKVGKVAEAARLKACHPYENSFTIVGAIGTTGNVTIWTLRVRVGDVFLLPNRRNPEQFDKVHFISMNPRECTGVFAGIAQ